MRSDSDVSTKDTREKHDEPNDDTLRESEALNADILRIDSIQDSDRGDSVGTAGRQEELSLPQSTAGDHKDLLSTPCICPKRVVKLDMYIVQNVQCKNGSLMVLLSFSYPVDAHNMKHSTATIGAMHI